MNHLDPRTLRRQKGLNQQDFWSRIGVTQSGGSRYESGRNMPKPVRELLRLVHVDDIDLATVNRHDFEIAAYLRLHHPDLYSSVKKAVELERAAPGGGNPVEAEASA